MRPIGRNVVIRRNDPITETKGGIIIPENYLETKSIGKVVAVSSGYQTDGGAHVSPQVQEGDMVIFDPYEEKWIDPSTNEIVIVDERHILAAV